MTHLLAPTISDDGLKRTLWVSAGVHLALLLFLYFGLPHLLPPLPVPHNPVPFEIVEVSELTNTRVKDQEEPKPKPPEQPPQPAKPPEAAAKPAPAPPTPPTPAPTPPQPKAVEQPQPEGLKPAPTPLQKPKPPEPAKPQQQQDFSKLLKNLEQKKPAAQPQEDTKADSKAPATPAVSSAPTLSSRLTISEEDALRRQIAQCWNMPVGARDAQKLIVEIKIVVNQDRTVQSADIVDKARMASDSFFRAAAESAVRALYNPRCSPLELPADKYQQWKNIDFTFDPRDML